MFTSILLQRAATAPTTFTNYYVFAAITAVLAFALSWIIANAVPYKGGKDKSYITRRWLWILIGFLDAAGYFFSINQFWIPDLHNMALQAQAQQANFISLGISLVVYVGLSITIMAINKKAKYGSIFFNNQA